ncbi:MAG TPA: RNA polymerase sigma-70 factor [Bacteroidales bacterium]|nr:RNA polymerase sigma-70 factor [Bacteroidales bacterium]
MNLDFDLYWDKIQNGDEFALGKVYKTAFRSLVYYASEITGQSQMAEEVVQDVFLKIWQNRSELLIKGSFKAYMFQSVHNHALNVVRQRNTRKESVNQICSEKTWQFISDTYDLNDDLIENIFSDETELIVERIIKELPEQCRKVFLMSRVESLKNEEIARQLGISNNTVRTHVYRALQKISSALKKEK